MIEYLVFYNNTVGKTMYRLAAWCGLLRKDTAYIIKGSNWILFYAHDTKRWVFTEDKS